MKQRFENPFHFSTPSLEFTLELTLETTLEFSLVLTLE